MVGNITDNLLAWLILLTVVVYIMCRIFDKGGKKW